MEQRLLVVINILQHPSNAVQLENWAQFAVSKLLTEIILNLDLVGD